MPAVKGTKIKPDPMADKNEEKRKFCAKHDGYGDFCQGADTVCFVDFPAASLLIAAMTHMYIIQGTSLCCVMYYDVKRESVTFFSRSQTLDMKVT